MENQGFISNEPGSTTLTNTTQINPDSLAAQQAEPAHITNEVQIPVENPFLAEEEAINAQAEAEQKAHDRKALLLKTVVSALNVDRLKEKKSFKFTSDTLNNTYSSLTLEQMPDGALNSGDQTRHKLSIAMGYKHPVNTENIAVCAVKLPVGVTIEQFDKIIKDMVGEDNFISKDYFRTSNPDLKTSFRNVVDTIRYMNTFSECGVAANAAPYREFKEQASSIIKSEEESLK